MRKRMAMAAAAVAAMIAFSGLSFQQGARGTAGAAKQEKQAKKGSTAAEAPQGKKEGAKAAAAKASGMEAPPVLWIERDVVPTERVEAYTDVIHRILNQYNQHQVVFRTLGMNSALPDSNEFMFLIHFNSFAELDEWERKFGEQPADFQKTMQHLEEQEADLRKSKQVMAAVFRPDLSYHADASAVAKARLLWVDQFIVTNGHVPDFESDVHFLSAAYEKAGIEDHYFMYQTVAGAESQTFIVMHPMKALADWDEAPKIAAKVAKGLDEAGKRRLARLWKDQTPQGVGLSVERLYVLRPDLSQTSDKFAGYDPEFWHQKKE